MLVSLVSKNLLGFTSMDSLRLNDNYLNLCLLIFLCCKDHLQIYDKR